MLLFKCPKPKIQKPQIPQKPKRENPKQTVLHYVHQLTIRGNTTFYMFKHLLFYMFILLSSSFFTAKIPKTVGLL